MSTIYRGLCCFNYSSSLFHLENLSFSTSNNEKDEQKENVLVSSCIDEFQVSKGLKLQESFVIQPKARLKSDCLDNCNELGLKTLILGFRNSSPLKNIQSYKFQSMPQVLRADMELFKPLTALNCFGFGFNQEAWLISQTHELETGCLVVHNKKLGDGAYGSVFEGTFTDSVSSTAIKVAVKVNYFSDNFRQLAGAIATLKREIHFLKFLNAQDPMHVSAAVEFIADGSLGYNTQCLVEKLGDFSLYEAIKKTGFEGLSIATVRKVALALFKTIHSFSLPHINIIHSDLKPENILFSSCGKRYRVTLIDFGFAQYVKTPRIPSKFLGTLYYRSPEIALGLPVDQSADMWSVACVLYETFTGRELFNAASDRELLLMIENLIGSPPESFVKKIKNFSQYVEFLQYAKTYRFKPDNTCRDNVYYTRTTFENYLKFEPSKFLESSKHQFASYLYTQESIACFRDLILSLLKWEPSERLKAEEVMQHPFFEIINELTRAFKSSSKKALSETKQDD